MRVIYRGIEIQDCRTQSLEVTPDYDSLSGIDFMRTRVRLVVSGIINPASTAYNAAGFSPGTRAGLTIINIRQALMTPQGFLQVYFGPDLIFGVPSPDPATGQPYPVDAKNGPLPHSGCSVVEGDFMGERTIIARWGVDFWIMGASNIILSNRWSCTHHVNRNGMTTRTLRGVAVMRAEAVQQGIAANGIDSIDDFRAALIVGQPLNFRRDFVDATCSEDGTELRYTVVDKEVGNSIAGNNSVQVFYLDGNASAGFDLQLKTYNDAIDRVTGFALGMKSALMGADIGAVVGTVESFLSSIIPRFRGRAMCRVEGGRNVRRVDLAVLASEICIDRSLGGFPTSLYFTQSLNADDGQSCEARMEWMPTITQAFGIAQGRLTPNNYMKLDNDYVRDKASLAWLNSGRHTHTNLPNSLGTRGSYVQSMAIQALSDPQKAPPEVPGEAAVEDRNSMQ